MATIAFFPWVQINVPLTVGPVRLIPYKRRRAPGNTEHVAQSDIDAVLKAYSISKKQRVTEATLMEFGDWRLGQDSDAETRAEVFRAREFVAFAALAKRRLFRHGYFNSDNYTIVQQRYTAGQAGMFSFSMRRRDGHAIDVWDNKTFAFMKPISAPAGVRLDLDSELLAALLAADEADQAPFDAVVEFNSSNTDQGYSTYLEIVQAKSAFESFFKISHDVDEFVHALLPLVPTRSFAGPLAQRWPTTRGRDRQRVMRPLEAWAREFCQRRNEAAHGRRRRGEEHFVWSVEAHLAYCSLLFPLLVKARLAENARMTMAPLDRIEIECIEAYLMHDPFEQLSEGGRPARPEWPWLRVREEEIVGEKHRREMRAAIESISQSSAEDQT